MFGDILKAERIYIACGYTDMRKSIDGLTAVVQQNFQLNPFQNSLFLFCGRRRDRMKALYWEGDGFVLLYKRLENDSFDEAETQADPMAPEPDLKEVQGYRRKKLKGQRMELLKDIPHDKRLCTLDVQDRFCEICNTTLVSVGEEFIRTEIEFIPAKVRVIDYYRETFECRTCRKNGKPYMEKSPMPYPVIQHSMASPSTVAWVMHQKFVNALPLYRQEKEWRTLGVNLSRATMANWILAASRDWLVPLVELMHQKFLQEKYLHAYETTVQVLNEEGRKNTTDSYMWVYSTGQHCKHPIRIFEYQPGRSGK